MFRIFLLVAVSLVGELAFGPAAWAQCPGGVCPSPQMSAPQWQGFANPYYSAPAAPAGGPCFCVEMNVGQLPYAYQDATIYIPQAAPAYYPQAGVAIYREMYAAPPRFGRQVIRQRYR